MAPELPTADPPEEFDEYQLVLLRRPPRQPVMGKAASDLVQRQHLGHLANLKDAGHLRSYGPLDNQPDVTLRGICIYRVGSLEEARRLAEMDPAVRAGVLAIEVMSWYTARGELG